MKNTLLGAQTYTVRSMTATKEGFSECMRLVADIGYGTVQLSAVGVSDVEFIRRVLDENGLAAVLTHTPPKRILYETDAVIAEHKLLGAGIVGLGSMPGEYFSADDGVDKFISDFKPAAQKLADAGLRFSYHNHFKEFGGYGGALMIDYLLSGMDGLMGLVFDTYWAQFGGADPVCFIGSHKKHIDAVHLKDMTVAGGKQQFADIFDGNMNFDGIIGSCLENGIPMFVERDESPDPMGSLKRSYDNIVRRFGRI